MHARTLWSLVSLLVTLSAFPALAQDNPECLGSQCGKPREEGGGGGGACVAGVCVGGGCSVWVAYTDDGKTLAYTDDADGDGKADGYDNCPFSSNRDQLDSDGDGVGNTCDNCASTSNFSQLDVNGDGEGDSCDADIDGDSLANALDNCQFIPNVDQGDVNADGVGDLCDDDDDGDGVLDVSDNCPAIANPSQNLLTDPRCNADADGDGINDARDNCLTSLNSSQLDTDLDGRGDACDLDLDDDGILNDADNCPGARNRGQWDEDADGLGDGCDARYCVVIDPSHKEDCLDPHGPFRVHGGGSVVLAAGEKFRLPLFANRNGAAMEYVWTVTQRPAGSTAAVKDPKGVVTQSRRWSYAYQDGNVPTFTADVDGEYSIQLQAHLVFEDRQYPEQRDSVSELKMTATPDTKGGMSCSAVPLNATFSVLSLALLALLRRRGGK
ncbi:MAG: thrombospondin type 3 repeat-containing protein [Myxococcales bacterium]|nr:thrombospondin type 3 repeat-containing protein [Myxococcales bacterium]